MDEYIGKVIAAASVVVEQGGLVVGDSCAADVVDFFKVDLVFFFQQFDEACRHESFFFTSLCPVFQLVNEN